MGKDNLLLGTARGKLGSVVFYRTGGEQRFRTRVRPNNPRTYAQLVQRCVVATAVKAYSPLQSVCNHSFQNYVGNAKNMERFMKLNIKWMREQALSQIVSFSPIKFADFEVGNWAIKDDYQVMMNEYIISEGDLPNIELVWDAQPLFDPEKTPLVNIQLAKQESVDDITQLTYAKFCELYGLEQGTQLTFVMVMDEDDYGTITTVHKARIILMPKDGDMNKPMFLKTESAYRVEINDPNPENYGNVTIGIHRPNDMTLQMTFAPFPTAAQNEYYAAAAIITSNYSDKLWRRSTSRLYMKDPSSQYVNTLKGAIASYQMVDKSSLYLNQSNDGEQLELQQKMTEEYRTAENIAEDEAAEEEESDKKTRRKRTE